MANFLLRGRIPLAKEIIHKINGKIANKILRTLPQVQAKSKIDQVTQQQLLIRI